MNTQIRSDFAHAEHVAIGDMQSSSAQRQKIIERLGHGNLAPEGIEAMTRADLRHVFGSATIGRYLSDSKRRKNKTYTPELDTGDVLERVVSTMKVMENIRQAVGELKTVLEDSNIRNQIADDVKTQLEQYIAVACEQSALFEACHMKKMQASVAELLEAGQRLIKKLPATVAQKITIVQRNIQKIEVKKLAASETEIYNLQRNVISILMRRRKSDAVQENSAEQYRLECVKDFSALGAFNEEDLLRYLVGSEVFIKTIHSEIEAFSKQQKNKEFKGNALYERFKGMERSFVQDTLGLALFAFPDKNLLSNGMPAMCKRWRILFADVYTLVHRVILGLADKKQNPLAETVEEDQTISLMHAILRAAIYPNYTIQLRMGYGGTDKNGVLVRSAGYALNALDIMEIFKKANDENDGGPGINPPTLHIVSAHELSLTVNQLDPAVTIANAANTIRFVESFVKKFYPSLASYVTFSQPSQEEVFSSSIYDLVVDAARQVAIGATAGTAKVREAWDAVASFATRHSTGQETAVETAVNYVAGHLMPAVFSTIGDDQSCSGVIWKIGGKTEEPFNHLQRSIRDVLWEKPEASVLRFPPCIFTTTSTGGRPPPYYRDNACPIDLTISEGRMLDPVREVAFLKGVKTDAAGAARDLDRMFSHPKIGQGSHIEGWRRLKQLLTETAPFEIPDGNRVLPNSAGLTTAYTL